MISLLLACQPQTEVTIDLAPVAPALSVSLDTPDWPDPDAPLTVQTVAFPPDFGVRKVYLDAGHGSGRNTGNTSSYCESEADVMVALSGPLAAALEATGHFSVRESRKPGESVSYRSRLSTATEWGAEVFISLHSDSRGALIPWQPTPDQSCYQSTDTPGFSVLWSDEGALSNDRQALARALATAMTATGFLPYDGGEYIGLYGPDTVGGVFVDRHEPRKRIMFLRRPTMPSVIIETHHAMDPTSAKRFAEPETLAAFHAAVISGLAGFLSPAP
ncbi:MAG: N-acetylmuramoyl-L-alanine amidase [Myxococcota bacterium]|jgi:N-acetylmuramoyl-L-alanine amidase